MTVYTVVLEVFSPSEEIRSLDGVLKLPFYSSPRELPIEGSTGWYAAVVLFDEEVEDEEAVERVLKWLHDNGATLDNIPGRKVLEVQCGLRLSEGCRFLAFPLRAMQTLVALNCELRVQYMRELSPEKLPEAQADRSD